MFHSSCPYFTWTVGYLQKHCELWNFKLTHYPPSPALARANPSMILCLMFSLSYAGTLCSKQFDEDLLSKELEEFGISEPIARITNSWYYRKKNTDTWIKVGESDERHENFPVRCDTTNLENRQYEVMGLMHVFVKKGAEERAIARENVVEIAVEN